MYPNVREDNSRFPHTCTIKRSVRSDDPLADDEESVTIYEGVCRSSDFHTTSNAGDVITSTRKLSLPIRQQEWDEDHPIPLEGDEVSVNKGSHKEYGIILDKMPGNLGTTLLWRFVRN